jgi:hypothetical protein
MDQNDWLTIPNFVCRLCGALLQVSGTEKRPVSEFYAIHPKGLCPLSEDWVRINPAGEITEQIYKAGKRVSG